MFAWGTKRKTKRRKISPPVATGHGKADKQAMAGKAQRWQEPLARYSRPPILHAFLPVLSLRTCYPIPCQHAVWFLFIRLQRSGYHGRWFVPRGSFYTWHTFLIAMQVTGSSAASIVCNVSMHLAPGKLPTTYKKVTHSAAADTRFQLCYWHDHIYPRKHWHVWCTKSSILIMQCAHSQHWCFCHSTSPALRFCTVSATLYPFSGTANW